MGKINQIIVFPNAGYDTGETSANKLNEAIKDVEVDGVTIEGDGISTPLSVVVIGDEVTRQRQTLAVVTNNIDLDWDSKNELLSSNRVAVSANVTITYLNASNAEFSDFLVDITNLATLTFPSGTISPDTNWSSLVWTPPENGKFSISIRKQGAEYSVLFTQAAAV